MPEARIALPTIFREQYESGQGDRFLHSSPSGREVGKTSQDLRLADDMKVEADSGGMYGQKNCRHACRSFSRLHGPGGFDSGRKSTHLHHCRRSSRFRPSNRIDHCCNFIPACRLRLRERAAEEMRSGYLCLNVVYAQVSALQ